MDLFTERLIPKKIMGKDIALAVLLFVVALIISAASFVFLGFAAIIITALVLYGAYYFASGILFVEYEYTLTNEELDIDKIIAKRKRVSLKSYNVKDFTEGGKYDGRKAEILCPDENSENLYYLEIGEGAKKECIVIDPNETMFKAFSVYMGARFKR
ncbi:MAG: hypothetical protein IKL74_04465 [Clostridia bacterium]|nr:hypothetical protein [Clostridia bacterium]